MSNHLISEAYKRQIGGLARKAVMVLLADKASDDGTGIWASKQRMADELGASKQTVIATIKALISDGLVTEQGQRKCPNGYTIQYAINVPKLVALPLVKSHADQSSRLTGQAASPVKHVDATGQVASPDQSSTLTQTLHNPTKPIVGKRTREGIEIPDWVPVEPWNRWLAMRKENGSKPTPGAMVLAIGKLERLRASGHDPGEVLDQSTLNNWKGLFEVRENERGRQQQVRGNSQAGADKRSSLARAIDEGLEWLG